MAAIVLGVYEVASTVQCCMFAHLLGKAFRISKHMQTLLAYTKPHASHKPLLKRREEKYGFKAAGSTLRRRLKSHTHILVQKLTMPSTQGPRQTTILIADKEQGCSQDRFTRVVHWSQWPPFWPSHCFAAQSNTER